ncbi:hypothetical protein I4U23_010686 [Adineta vaga]|nr:hypothetical protein I4U23_010686 [Adineta vaga]
MDASKVNTNFSLKEETRTDDDLAIIGIACRFPGGSNSIDEFWSNLVEKHDCVRPVPDDRWNADYYTDPASNELHLPAKIPTSRCGWIDFVGEFDYETFSIGKREAENMDPQQKLLLEVTLQALEDSGMQYMGSKTGVYVGIGQAEQYELTTADLESINAYSVTGSALSISSNRLSYCFDLRGPSMSIDTACSSSLTAFHLACQAIRDGTCTAAVVAGVNIIINPSTMIQFSQLGVLSPDGMCQSFSNRANGYVRSEGCGVVIIKSLKQALIDNDHIYCRIKGSAINQDGHLSPSLTMPSSQAQMEVFRMACKNAQVNSSDIFYVEAHATGTKVGDPTEANAIGAVFGRKESCLRIGSVKSNVGHLETASFMAGLLKCILMLEHQQLVPNIHFIKGEENSDIKFEQYNLSVQTEIEKFQNQEALMMISSFGFGGANGCAIIQGYSQSSQQKEISSSLPYLFLISASTTHALEARIKELKSSSSSKTVHSLASISHTLYNRPLNRLVTFAIDEQLNENTTFVPIRKCLDQSMACVWVFAGQGPQHPQMGKILYSNVESFRSSIDASDSIYRACSGQSLIDDIGLFGSKTGSNAMAVYEIAYTLPALVFLQIGLVDMYRDLGVPCAAVFGHSFGEMAAGYAANICTRKQCIETAYHRARILRQVDGLGAMLAASCSREYIQPLLDTHEQVWIAAYNGPNSLTLGGIKESITGISNQLSKENIFNRILRINSAYHTPLLTPIRSEALSTFKKTLAGCSVPTIPYCSTVTGQWKDSDFDEKYTFDGIEGPVLFDAAVRQCLERFGVETTVFLEISAHSVLSSYLTENGSKYNLCTLHRQQSDIETTLKTLANLRIFGCSPKQANITKIYPSMITPPQRIPHYFPYLFQRQYCVKEDPAHRLQRIIPTWYSLAGRPLAHPYPTFQTKLSLKSSIWIEDHRVQGPAVFPAAGYIEICMEIFNSMILTNIQIEKALVLPSDPNTYRTIRIILDDINQSNISMYSKLNEYDNGNWIKHMKATKGDSSSSSLPQWTNNIKSRCSFSIFEQKDIYGRFSSVGLDYGPYFQCIQTLYQGDYEAYAHLNISHLPKPLSNSKQSRFHIHPAILDSTFQVLLGTQRYFHTAYVPTFIQKIEWKIETNELPDDLYVYAKTIDTQSKQILKGDIFIVDEQQQRLIGMIIGFEATALGQSNQSQPLYTLHYQDIQTPLITTREIRELQLNIIEIPTVVKEQESLFYDACLLYIVEFLHSTKYDLETIQKWPIHRQRYWEWLHLTAKSEIKRFNAIELIDHSEYEILRYEAQAIHRVGKNLSLLLNDNFAVQNIFFGENDSFMSDLYSKSLTFQPYTHFLAQKLVDQFKTIEEEQPSRVFSILELGAGTGALTSIILEKLSEQTTILKENRLIYVFTDVSGKFLLDAKKRFSSIYPCIQYQLCNLDNDLFEQKLNLYSFDVICAFDVLHVAQDLKLCLNRIQQLLKPNGFLLCIELTRPWKWIEFFFGLFAGWWHFIDTTIRSTCYLSVDKWYQLLNESGFQYIYIENEGQPEFAHSLITARRSDWSIITQELSSNILIIDTTEATVVNMNSYMEKLLSVAQSLIQVTESTTVFVLTLTSTPPIGATFTGFTRVWANENTQHKICSIEFDVSELQNKQIWLNRIETIVEKTDEREFIINQDKIYVPRHIPRTLINSLTMVNDHFQSSNEFQTKPFRLEIDTIGQLQTLKYRSFNSSSSLAPTDVQVEVHASALNFKDLMLALGMLENPMDFDKETLKYRENLVNLGLEFSGIVTDVGLTSSKTFQVGDLVFGFANHCFSSQIVTHQDFVVKKPSHLSHIDVVSLPIVFATVYAGLIDKAQLKRGEIVLIHSAAGGIGQAAIQLAHYIGASVICTVGSNEKREFLRNTYGCAQFANSHSTEEWKSDVMKLTDGRGVDVVLNSLKGDAIQAGLECLRGGGRFIEIGKVDILNHSKLDMNIFLRNLSFLSVQLDILMHSQTDKIQQYLQAVQQLAFDKHITPIIDSIYELKDTELAFRFLMSGQHKGKLVLNMQSKPSNIHPPSAIYNSMVCYILSGGTGALGLQLVQHMSAHGARHFILLSRQGKNSLRSSDATMLDRLGRFGIEIYIGQADVAQQEDILRVLEEAQQQWIDSPSKYSILHLAMVLDDAPISKLNIQRIENVMRCKVQGAINLLKTIPNDKLEHAIFFSSAASTFGNPSQANYSAANTFLDAYAGQLSKSSKAKVRVVNLGLVEDVGILAEDWKLKQILTAKGFAGGLTSAGVAQLVDHAFLLNDNDQYQMLYGNFQMKDLIHSYPILKTRLEHLINHSVTDNSGNPGSSSNGNEVTIQTVSTYISTLLATSNLDNDESLTVQGLDSLLAVELSAGLKKQFGLVISQLTLLGGMSVKQIVETIST